MAALEKKIMNLELNSNLYPSYFAISLFRYFNIAISNIWHDELTRIEWPFKKGFCSGLLNDEINKELFYDAINVIDESVKNIPIRKAYKTNDERLSYRVASKEIVEEKCKKINEVILKKYGQTAADYILRGLKKSLMQMPFAEIKLKDYQQKIILQTCDDLKIDL